MAQRPGDGDVAMMEKARGARRCDDGGTVESRAIQGDVGVPFGLGASFRRGHGAPRWRETRGSTAPDSSSEHAVVAPAAGAPALCRGPETRWVNASVAIFTPRTPRTQHTKTHFDIMCSWVRPRIPASEHWPNKLEQPGRPSTFLGLTPAAHLKLAQLLFQSHHCILPAFAPRSGCLSGRPYQSVL